jgi:hypothetical protein
MPRYIDYDPDKHGDRKLYEVQGKELEEGVIASVIVPSDTPHEIAKQTPWYYVVEAEEGEE